MLETCRSGYGQRHLSEQFKLYFQQTNKSIETIIAMRRREVLPNRFLFQEWAHFGFHPKTMLNLEKKANYPKSMLCYDFVVFRKKILSRNVLSISFSCRKSENNDKLFNA